MPSPDGSFNLSGRVYGGSATSIGNLMVADGTGFYLVANAANRALYGRAQAIATSNWGGAQSGVVSLQFVGTCDSNLPNVGVGTAGRWVRCSAAGAFEVFTPTNGGSSDIVGCANAAGVVTMLFGVLTETMLVGGGGSFTPPTGNGFATVTAGALDAAAKAGNTSGGPLLAPAALVVGDMYYASSTSALSRIPKGGDGQTLTLVSGVPTWTGTTAVDPDTIAWEGAWGPAYAASPWAGKETPSGSTGTTSGGRNAVATVNAPSVTTINSLNVPLFNGTNTDLDPATGDLQNYVNTTTGACSGLIVCRPSTAVSDNTTSFYANPPVLGESAGVWFVGFSTAGFMFGFNASGGQKRTLAAGAIGNGYVLAYRYDGTNISLSSDYGVTWNDNPATWVAGTVTSRVPYIGRGNTSNFAGAVGDVRMKNLALAKATLASMALFLKQKYAF